MSKQTSINADQYRAFVSGKGGSKYRNHPQMLEGIRYHSKAELAFEMRLRFLKSVGNVAWWVRQVPFSLPAGGATAKASRYLLDFLIVQPKGVRLVDVKGFLTPTSKVKISVIQATHGVSVELVAPKDIATWA